MSAVKKEKETMDKKPAGVPASTKTINFDVLSQGEVPHGRNGKHKGIVTRILDDLDVLKEGKAMRIRLDELPDTKEKVRAALSRALKQKNIEVMTSTDKDHLYIWRASRPGTHGNSHK